MVRSVASVLGMLGAVIACACGKTSSATPARMSCGQLFAPPPAGELLCDEHVMPRNDARGEIHWRSYGLPQERGFYCDQYLAAARACGYGFAFKPPLCDVTDNQGRRVELFFSMPTEMGGADYPKCGRAPDPKHQTIIVIADGPR